MSRISRFLGVVSVALVVVAVPGPARAGSIDYLTNQSADYIRTLCRNAAVDGADIVVFNPAGTAFMKDGLYFSLSGQTIFKKFEIEYQGQTFGADDPTPFLPSFFTVWKWNSLSVYGAFTIPAGGGSLTYEKGVPFLIPLSLVVPEKDGTALPVDGQFEGSSMFLAGTVGVAYEFVDIVSISAAARLISSRKTFTGSARFDTLLASLDATKTALGVGGVFGIHVRPVEWLDISVRYEMETALKFETESTTVNLTTAPDTALASFANGATEQRNLPAVLGIGLAARPIEQLTLSASFNYYFIKKADAADDPTGATGYVISYDDDYDNGMDISFAVEYQFLDELVASIGYNRSIAGGNADTYSDFEYALDSHAVGTGVRYTFFDRLSITGSFAAVLYDEAENTELHPLIQFIPPGNPGPFTEKFNKTSYVIGLGIEYRAL